MSKQQYDTGSPIQSTPEVGSGLNRGRKLRQNALLILTGLYDVPMKFLVTVREERDGPNIRLFRDADGGFFDGDSRAEIVMRDEILKLSETRPDDMFARLRDEFGAVNVFLVPPGGFLAARLLSEGISVFCVFECGVDAD